VEGIESGEAKAAPSDGSVPANRESAPSVEPSSAPSGRAKARGAVLAGGRGSRLGGAKATAELAGRPLIAYPLAALAAAGLDPFVVAKPDTDLPVPPAGNGAAGDVRPPDLEVVREAEEPVHPLVGIIVALRYAGRPVVVLGCDFPFVSPGLVRALADAPEPLVVPAPGGDPQPLVARWTPALLADLEAALAREEPLRRTVASLSPRLLDDAALARFEDPARVFFNVNTPADLGTAQAML
jgi:molybdenum cofactor guanylyltransferase